MGANASIYFARLIELPRRLFNYEKKPKVVFNGENNDYAERVQLLTENSITASQGRALYKKFLFGKGIASPEVASAVVGGKAKPGYTINRLCDEICDEFSEQHGFAVHVQYNLEGEPVSHIAWPFASVRVGLIDDDEKPSGIARADHWVGDDYDKDKIKWYYRFNPDPDIVQKQIAHSGSIEKYPGQVFFFNPHRTPYPISPIHAVMNDADSEFRASVYKNKSLRKGFFGKNILVTPPFVESALATSDPRDLDEAAISRLRKQEESRKGYVDALKGFVGVENNEGFMHLEMEHNMDDIDKAIKHISIPTDIDDKLFSHTEESCSNNIRKAYANAPKILVENTDAGVFSDSGAQLRAAKEFYQEQTESARMMLEDAIYQLLSPAGYTREQLKFQSLIEPQNKTQDGAS